MNKQFVLFVTVGGIAALANWLSRFGLSVYFNLELSVVLAYLVGMTIAYVLNRAWVFEKSGRSVASEYIRFGAINLVALLQVFVVTIGLSQFVFPALGMKFYPEPVAHGLGVASPVLTSYLGHKFFTFSVKPSPEKGK